MLSTFLFLDQIARASRSGIYKNKERAKLIGKISLYCWMSSSTCTSVIEAVEIARISASIKKLEKELKQANKYKEELYQSKLKKSNERLLAFIKSSLDIVVAIGLLQLAPKRVTPRVTGGLGFITSLISCYQVLNALFNICKINKRRQEQAAENGIIPHLMNFIMSDSPLRQYALSLLCDMAHASQKNLERK